MLGLALIAAAQLQADQSAGSQAHEQHADFDQHIARGQDLEECLDAQADLVHAFKSGMS